MADEHNDQLDAGEIEALLKSAGGGAAPASGKSAGPSDKSAAGKNLLNGNDIEALLQQGMGAGDPAFGSAEDLLNRAEADLAAAVSPDLGFAPGAGGLGSALPFEFEEFNDQSTSASAAELTALQEVELDLRIELGRTELLIEEVLKLREGSVVPLDKLAGDPVDILVNGKLIARGEVLVLNDNFCVRIAEILAPALD